MQEATALRPQRTASTPRVAAALRVAGGKGRGSARRPRGRRAATPGRADGTIQKREAWRAARQVLDVVGESVALFDEVNVATALHRLAKLQPPGTSGPQSPIVYADQFQALVEAVQRLLDRFEAQAISNTLWGARGPRPPAPGPGPPPPPPRAASPAGCRTTRRRCRPAPGRCSRRGPARAALVHAARSARLSLRSSTHAGVQCSCTSGAPGRSCHAHTPSARHLCWLLHRAPSGLQACRAPDAARAGGRAAFATLAYHPEGDLLDRLAHHAASIVRTFRPQATSNSLWAFAKLAYVPCQPFLLTSASQARRPLPAARLWFC